MNQKCKTIFNLSLNAYEILREKIESSFLIYLKKGLNLLWGTLFSLFFRGTLFEKLFKSVENCSYLQVVFHLKDISGQFAAEETEAQEDAK